MASFLNDLKTAARGLLRTPLATTAILVTLAIGVGMTTAIHAVLERALVRPLPYANADELVAVEASWPAKGIERARFGGEDWTFLSNEAKSFHSLAAAWTIRQNLTGAAHPEQVQVGWVSGNLFEVLGVDAMIGRRLRSDDPPGTVVVSESIWRRQLGGRAEALNSTFRLDGHPVAVVGVLPDSFRLHLSDFPRTVDVWKSPDALWQNGDVWTSRGSEFAMLSLLGRLQDGTSIPAAREELGALAGRMREDVPDYADAGLMITVEPLADNVIEGSRNLLTLLGGAVTLVLFIALANILDLQAARARRRRAEIGVRLALGADRGDLARILMAEGVLLAALGGLAALALGLEGIDLLQRVGVDRLPRIEEVGLDGRVTVLALGITLAVTTISSSLPLLGATRRNLSLELRSKHTTSDRRGRHAGRAMVVGQVALSLVLLHGAGLLLSSLARLTQEDSGFRADHHLTFAISLPGTRYERPLMSDRFFRTLEERLQALPQVESVGTVWPLPLGGSNWRSLVHVPGQPAGEDWAQQRLVTPNLFETLEIPLLEGRTFLDTDPRRTVVVSRSVAERLWPGQSAVGRTLIANPWGHETPPEFRVVGVVGDVRHQSLREQSEDTVYFDSRGWSWTDWEIDVVVRTSRDPTSLIEAVREEVAALDVELPVADTKAYRDVIEEQMAPNRFALGLIGLFAGVAVLLTVIGLYGVVAFSVSRRTREMGIRMAVGATKDSIRALVLGEGLRLGIAGILLGAAAAWGITQFFEGLLYNVTAGDPVVFGVVSVSLLLLAVAACWAPARQAARLDPIQVLREE